jgi:hypothetical protein
MDDDLTGINTALSYLQPAITCASNTPVTHMAHRNQQPTAVHGQPNDKKYNIHHHLPGIIHHGLLNRCVAADQPAATFSFHRLLWQFFKNQLEFGALRSST